MWLTNTLKSGQLDLIMTFPPQHGILRNVHCPTIKPSLHLRKYTLIASVFNTFHLNWYCHVIVC